MARRQQTDDAVALKRPQHACELRGRRAEIGGQRDPIDRHRRNGMVPDGDDLPVRVERPIYQAQKVVSELVEGGSPRPW